MLAASISSRIARTSVRSKVGWASQSVKSSTTRSNSTLFSHNVSSASKISV